MFLWTNYKLSCETEILSRSQSWSIVIIIIEHVDENPSLHSSESETGAGEGEGVLTTDFQWMDTFVCK